ncbi:MAG: helix-turn-helix transcriptional regulator [Alphaproteobacteria bacterium]|nr:helix-turn-helix transcriptional regulator [Alphaproteobacteria bacterium]MBU1515606.1 helix-turn-helix transcriptional regulator [Alphaproteobacteria bacterium]MBU2096941.1 helix-turn-helix transcriptional regulator [Alphaproteobacteria bacterium]MBU2149596.1 helix-turn-helix transcriptional regulator [Alphaproteobacteria bacterium]MBU2305668.1 helix-turn-helix transcriptional regulator [Alphaproteobacteria bacterium]
MAQLVRPEFETVVTGLYEAATLSELWPSALDGLAALLGSRGALVTRPDRDHDGLMYSAGLKDTVSQFFEQNWHLDDLRSTRLMRRPPNQFVRDQDITSVEERARLAYYEGFARSAGVPWFAACGVIQPDGAMLGISIQRSADEGAFDDADLERLIRIEHHARAALSFSRRVVETAQAERLQGLDRIDVAALLLDREGRVRAMNARAEQDLPGAVSLRRRRVLAHDPAARRGLDQLIARACARDRATAGRTLTAVRLYGPDGASVLAQVLPLVGAAHDLIGDGRAILTLTPIGRTAPADQTLLATAFGLTTAEARVAHLLSQGLEVNAIAQALGVSANAVRYHLKAILPKAGVQRQAAFVAMAAELRRPN